MEEWDRDFALFGWLNFRSTNNEVCGPKVKVSPPSAHFTLFTLVGSGHSQVPILGDIGFTFVGPGSQPTTHFGCHWFLTWEYISTLSLLWAWDHQLNPEFLLENLLMVPRSGLRGEAGATQAAYVFVILSKTCIIIFQK